MLILIQVAAGSLWADENSITIEYNNEIGSVNKYVLGSALEGWDHALVGKGTNPVVLRSNFGGGIWDPVSKKIVNNVVILAKNAGLSAIRFTTTNFYKWKMTIGKERKQFLFGIDEFMKASVEIGAVPIFTIGYMLDDPHDAADLVEYLNLPSNKHHPWAIKRAENGHPSPYNAKFFEIGNEVFNKSLKVSPEDYATKYLKYYVAMKSKDPTVQIGVVLGPYAWWDSKVLKIIKDKVDFGVIHFYPKPPGIRMTDKRIEKMKPSEIFSATLAMPVLQSEVDIQNMLKLLKKYTGKNIPLAVTEYNGGFAQNKPVPYRHTLGTALINAELLRIFMKPKNNILMANNHTFVNGYWSMIKSKYDFMKRDYNRPIIYVKRPNYYVYELYNNHFGDILIENSINGETYKIKGETGFGKQMIKRLLNKTEHYIYNQIGYQDNNKINQPDQVTSQKGLTYLSVNTSKSSDGKTVYIMVINKNMHKAINSSIEIKGFHPTKKANTWVLNGPSVDATNENKSKNVMIRHKEFMISNDIFTFEFEPHSLTAIEVTNK